MTRATRDEVLLELTRSICPVCRLVVDAEFERARQPRLPAQALPRARRVPRSDHLVEIGMPAASRWIKADRLHPLLPRETPRWRKLYKGRASVEREFGRLKNEWALLPSACEGRSASSSTLT
jgi:hypothetical protein